MIATPLAQYLSRFDDGSTALAGLIDEPAGFDTLETEPMPDIPSMLEAARAEAAAESAIAAEARLLEMSQRFEKQLAAARQIWAEEQSDRLANLLASSLADIESRLCAATADVLLPFLDTALRERAIDALTVAVSSLTREAAGGMLSVSGPPDLINRLESRLDGQVAIELHSAPESVDVTVRLGQTLIDSQLAAWAMRLREGAG